MAHWKRFIYVVIALFSLQLTARAQETETFVHTIKQGETVYSIARTYQVSPESILKLNPTASTGIKAGGTLTIPQINPDLCIGCGGCESICPVRPMRAIIVKSNVEHKFVEKPKEEEIKEIEVDDFGF